MTVLPKRRASTFKAESSGGRVERKRALARALRMETLEKRELFAADARNFFNGYYPNDVNADMKINSLDALMAINDLNKNGARQLAGVSRGPSDGFVDADGDNALTSLDVLKVVNFLNSRQAEEGLGEVASIRYQVFAALPNGTADTTRLLGQTVDGGALTTIDVGVGQQIVLRAQMNDLRPQGGAVADFGVFSGVHDIRIENVDNSATERLQLVWGEYNELAIPSAANAGSFTLRYAATAEHPQVDVVINAGATRANIQTALENAFGTGNVRVIGPEVDGGNRFFDINFVRGRSRSNIGDATVINNTLTAAGVPVQPTYIGDPSPSPTNELTTSAALNHRISNDFQFEDENGVPRTRSYTYDNNTGGFATGAAPVRVATERNYVLRGAGAETITMIDGVSVNLGDRVLVRSQTNPAENGVYVVADVAVESTVRRNLVRATDADRNVELIDALFRVSEGTEAGRVFQQKTQNITLDVSPITFGVNSVTTLREVGGVINPIEPLFLPEWASTYVSVVDVLFRTGSAGEVRLDARLTPTGIPDVLGGLALFDAGNAFITDPSAVLLASNLRIRILDELTAFPDVFPLDENSAATLLNVLQNDVDRLNRTFTIISVSNLTPAIGAVQVANNGTRVEFTPVTNANGAARFTYTIRNSAGNESTTTVTVNVAPKNDPPIPLTPNPRPSIAEDTLTPGLVLTPTLLFSPGPADESSQTVSFTGTPSSPNGTVTISGGNINFVPASNYFGDATIVVTGTDSLGASTTATFTVTVTPVNDDPVVGTRAFNVAEDTPAPALTIPVATLFSPGPANESAQTVTLTIVSPPSPEGTAQIQNGSLVFTPSANFFGTVNITVRGTDNGVTGTAADPKSTDSIITITVTPVNDNPDAVDDDLAVIGLNTAQPLDVLANDSPGQREQGSDTIRVTGVTQPSVGSVAIGPNGTNVIFTPPGGVFDQFVTFTYTITDSGNQTDTATVEVYIAPPARPFALDDTIRIPEDSNVTDLNVLLNDFVRTGANAVLESIDSVPAGQSPIIPATQGTLVTQGNLLRFTPTPQFFGDVARFTYRMNDDSGQIPENGSRQVATVTVIVTEVNDDPQAVNLDRNTNEDTPLPMTGASITTGLSRGPNEDAQTLTITAARVINSEAGSISLTNGNLTYTPALNFFGTANIEYTVTDNGTTNGVAAPRSSTATIVVRVDAVNDDPVTNNKSFNGVEDTNRTIAISDVSRNDQPGPSNESSQSVSFVGLGTSGLANAATSQGGSVSVVGTNVVYTPAANFNGQDTFVYRVTDNGSPAASALGTVTINVSEVNDDPVATNVTRGNVFASVRTEFNLTEDLRNMSRGAANESSQTLRIVSVGRSTLGVQPTISANGTTIIYTAPLGASGQDSFSYTVEDNGTSGGVVDVKRSTASLNVNILPFIPSSFTGFVYVDDDRNNRKDTGDLALGGVDVYLYEGTPNNRPDRSTWKHEVTDAAGRYDFGFLPPGTFTVEYVVPSFITDSDGPNFLTRTIVAPGDVHVRQDFTVVGLIPGYGNVLENLASSYYLQDNQLRSAGLVAVMGADGKSEWTSVRGGGFETDSFHEVVLSDDRRSAYITAVRGATNEVFMATLTNRRNFVIVQDPEGRTLIRVIARAADLTWTRVNAAAPPVLPARKFFDAVDEFFSTMADD